ncbi:MAG TPA: hypothetical protein VMU05_25630 [Dongiaceae bacterium]|nr:hypothetical protein [Dongiaceae bacterium]
MAKGADPYALAVVQGHLLKSKEMYVSLEKAYAGRSTQFLYSIQTEPAFDPFRSEPAFRDLMQKMGFTQ